MCIPNVYQDSRGWIYKVQMNGQGKYKAQYHKPFDSESKWRCVSNLLWRYSFDEAQTDLDVVAKKKKWIIER